MQTQYFKDAQIALLANGEDTAAHAEELEKFKAVRAAAKKAVDEMLKREKEFFNNKRGNRRNSLHA